CSLDLRAVCGRHASRQDRGYGFLETRKRTLRAKRGVPVGKPAIERDRFSESHGVGEATRQTWWRVSWRGTGTELQLHRDDSSPRRFHHRHSPSEHARASHVQSDIRVVSKSRRVHLPSVFAHATQRLVKQSNR